MSVLIIFVSADMGTDRLHETKMASGVSSYLSVPYY